MNIDCINISSTIRINVVLDSVKCDAIIQIFAGKNKPENWATDGEYWMDIDTVDYENVFFMGMPIGKGYKEFSKFKKHLMEMGIDVVKMIDDEAQKVYSKESIIELLKPQLESL